MLSLERRMVTIVMLPEVTREPSENDFRAQSCVSHFYAVGRILRNSRSTAAHSFGCSRGRKCDASGRKS